MKEEKRLAGRKHQDEERMIYIPEGKTLSK
jgi:hypothetical protein